MQLKIIQDPAKCITFATAGRKIITWSTKSLSNVQWPMKNKPGNHWSASMEMEVLLPFSSHLLSWLAFMIVQTTVH